LEVLRKRKRALESAGLVRGEAREGGRQRLWALQSRRLREARLYLDRISDQWDGALARLKRFVEE